MELFSTRVAVSCAFKAVRCAFKVNQPSSHDVSNFKRAGRTGLLTVHQNNVVDLSVGFRRILIHDCEILLRWEAISENDMIFTIKFLTVLRILQFIMITINL